MAIRKTSAGSKVFIFLGPEIGKKQTAINEIRKKFFGNNSCEETVFYADETAANQMVFEIQNQSLFSQARLFLIKNAELIKKKEETDAIISCIDDIDPETVLILISDELKLAAALDDLVPKQQQV